MGVSGDDPRVALFVGAAAFFGEQVAVLPGDAWELATPCPDWDIRQVVTHVILGEAQLTELAEGRRPVEAELDVGILGANPMSVWRGTALRAIEAARATPLDRRVPHAVGDLSFGRVLGFRITDNLVHAWDIATARSAACVLPDDIAEWALDFWLPMADGLVDSGYFGPMQQPAGSSPGERLLALLGRAG